MILVGRWSGAAVLGEVQSGLSLANLNAIAAPGSIGAAAGRYGAAGGLERFRMLKRIYSIGILFTTTTAILLGVWSSLATDRPVTGIAVGSLAWSISATVIARGVYLAGGWKLKGLVRTDLFGSLVGLLLAVVGVVVAARWEWYAFALAFSGLPLFAYVHVILRGSGGARGATKLPTGFWTYVAFAALGSLASSGLFHFTALSVRAFGSVQDVGWIAAGMALVMPMNLLVSSLGQVLLPRMTVFLHEKRESRALHEAGRLTLALGILAGLILAIVVAFGEFLVLVIYGPGFEPALRLLGALGLAMLSLAIRSPVTAMVSAQGPKGVRRLAICSWMGFFLAVGYWIFVILRDERLDARHAVYGYAAGAVLSTILISIGVRRVWVSMMVVALLSTWSLLIIVLNNVASGSTGGWWGNMVVLSTWGAGGLIVLRSRWFRRTPGLRK